MKTDEPLGRLYLSIRGRLARAVTKIVPPSEVEDVLQETYVRVYKASLVSSIRSPESFMLKTARNLALDYVKRADYRLVDSFGESTLSEVIEGEGIDSLVVRDTLDRCCSDEDFSIFCAAARNLPDKCRRAFILRKVYGYSQREIAQEMQISEKTVEGHIANGITRCRQSILERRGERGKLMDTQKQRRSSVRPRRE